MKKTAVVIRHIKDASIKSALIVDSHLQTFADLKAFVKSNPASAFAIAPEDWIVQVFELEFGDIDNNNKYNMTHILTTGLDTVVGSAKYALNIKTRKVSK